MKTYILTIALFIGSIASAQNLDTVYVRNTIMPSGDWAYLAGSSLSREMDSIMIVALRRMKTAITAANPANFNTNVTIDSIPGRAMVIWYKELLFSPFAETRNRGGNIMTVITGKAVLATFIAEIDVRVGDLFIKERTRGKNYLLDTN
jgi:hypothetical protein